MQPGQLNRRQCLALLGVTAATTVARPPIAHAQQGKRTPRLGILMAGSRDSNGRRRVEVLRDGLRELGWTEGRNFAITLRWAGGGTAGIQSAATDLVGLGPDVILANGTRTVAALLRETRTIPIVFAGLADPVADGFVASMARPGGNVTGFTNFQPSLIGKMLEALKEISPKLSHAVLLLSPDDPSDAKAFGDVLESAAATLGVRPNTFAIHQAADIERTLAALGDEGGSGLVVAPSAYAIVHRKAIIAAVARHRVPAIYPFRVFIGAGGLAFYGANIFDVTRRAASYVDRILKGERPADLPVQAPSKYELIINLRTAKALSLVVPPSLLLRADEVVR